MYVCSCVELLQAARHSLQFKIVLVPCLPGKKIANIGKESWYFKEDSKWQVMNITLTSPTTNKQKTIFTEEIYYKISCLY